MFPIVVRDLQILIPNTAYLTDLWLLQVSILTVYWQIAIRARIRIFTLICSECIMVII